MIYHSLGNRGPKLTGEKISSPKNHLRKINFHGIQESDPPENQNQKIANYWWYQETLLAATYRQKKQGGGLELGGGCQSEMGQSWGPIPRRISRDAQCGNPRRRFSMEHSVEELKGALSAVTLAANSRWAIQWCTSNGWRCLYRAREQTRASEDNTRLFKTFGKGGVLQTRYTGLLDLHTGQCPCTWIRQHTH